MGQKTLVDRHGPFEIVGGHLLVFKFVHASMFQKKNGITPEATPSSCAEKTFMLALQCTNNRMMN